MDAAGLPVVVVEQREIIGGACINTGTIPSKTMREAVLHLAEAAITARLIGIYRSVLNGGGVWAPAILARASAMPWNTELSCAAKPLVVSTISSAK